jgi:hypothetical protein
MNLTDYHAKYFAHELTKRCPSDSVEMLVGVLADAQVDLNPHQIEAALFAFRNPFSRGAILADEVGLGKTIEAGLLLAQRWAERKRKLLVILPANLRKQWNQELADKFYLPSMILETRTFNEANSSFTRPTGVPHKTDLVQSRPPFRCHFVLISALSGNPVSKPAISFAMRNRYATMSLPLFEPQEGCKTLLPKIIAPTPNKSYGIQALSAFHR